MSDCKLDESVDALCKTLYLDQNMSLRKVAEAIGKTESFVTRTLKQQNVTLRNRREAALKYAKFSDCVICGTNFRMRGAWDSTASHHRTTCSPECEFELRSNKQKTAWLEDPTRKERMGEILKARDTSNWNIPVQENRSNWNGGITSYTRRKIAFVTLGLEEICESCGTTDGVCVHHIDRDKSNNTKENLKILCRSCHTGDHARSGDNGWKLHNARKAENGSIV